VEPNRDRPTAASRCRASGPTRWSRGPPGILSRPRVERCVPTGESAGQRRPPCTRVPGQLQGGVKLTVW